MGRQQTYDAWTDVCEEVSQDAFLADHRPLPHLFNLVPPLGFRAAGSDVDITALAAVVRAGAEGQSDVRLLIGDPDRNPTRPDGYVTAARQLANALRCDVYLPPADARVRYLRESSSVAGESWDAVAVRSDTGEPTPWLLVRPDERTDAVPSWIISTAGRLRQNNGLITVPLPRGLAFATPATFRETATLARHLTVSTPRLTTLAVVADIGRFEISRFNEASALLGGVEFATLVAASLDHIEPDVQLALTWPADDAARVALDVELMRFADALDRTVWVPRSGGSAAVLARRGEFAAMDEQGRPAGWQAYRSRLATAWRPGYGTDTDGCLLPADQLGEAPGRPVGDAFIPPQLPRPLAPMTRAAIVAAVGESVAMAMADPIAEAVRLAERAAARPVFMPASPTVLLATLAAPTARPPAPRLAEVAPVAAPAPPGGEHLVSWLPPSVVVNERPEDLYVWLPPAAAHAKGWAVSAPDTFLLAGTDPDQLAAGAPGRILRLTAPAGSVVHLDQHLDLVPASVSGRIRPSAHTRLLPLSWLAGCQVTGLFDVDGRGGHQVRELADPTIDVHFDGADHGIPGLPNDVVSWPAEAERSGTPSYLVLPADGRPVHSGFAALSRTMPVLEAGHRLLEIRIRRRHAIDVPATLLRLAGLPMLGRLGDLAGFDLLLAEQHFTKAVVSKVWWHGPDGEPVVDKLGGQTLSDILANPR